MNFGKPSGNTFKVAAAATAGAIAGGMASRAVVELVHNPATTTDAAEIKKQDNQLLMKRVAVAALGVTLAASVTGSDATAAAISGSGTGMAIVQGLEIIKSLAAKSGSTAASKTDSKAKRAGSAALGLGCPCGGDSAPALNGYRRRRGALNAPVYDAPAYAMEIVPANDNDFSSFAPAQSVDFAL